MADKEKDVLEKPYFQKLFTEMDALIDEVLADESAGSTRKSFKELVADYRNLDAAAQRDILRLAKQVGVDPFEDLNLPDMPAEFKFTLGDDLCAVSVDIKPPVGAGKMLTAKEIISALTDEGVTYGINTGAIEKAVAKVEKTGVPAVNIVIAEGDHPVHGKNGEISFKIKPLVRGKNVYNIEAPKKIEFNPVSAGDVVAVVTAPERGVPGKDVFGEPIPALHGSAVAVTLGENIDFNEDTGSVLATVDGVAVVEDDRIRVEELLVIDSDVSLVTGNVEFPGTVIIKGSVSTGLYVHAKDDIIIEEGVEGARVESEEGSVIIKQGIQGHDRALVAAARDVKTTFIEHAKVFADRDVIVENSILNSEVSAGNMVEVYKGQGHVLGGITRAGKLIKLREIGNEKGRPSEVVLGITPEMLRSIMSMDDEIASIEERKLRIEETVDPFLKLGSDIKKLPPDKIDKLVQLQKSLVMYNNNIRIIKKQKKLFTKQLERSTSGRLEVYDKLYPETTITIGKHVITSKNEYHYTGFFYDEAEQTIGFSGL